MTSNPDDVGVLSDEATFYLSKDDQTYGPHSISEIESFLKDGVVVPENLLWTEGMEEWLPISQLFRAPATAEVPVEAKAAPEIEPAAPTADVTEGLASWHVARAGNDGQPRRLSMAVTIAIIFHLCLLVTLSLGASTFFKINNEVAAVPAPEQPPMEVSLVTEDDPPPPEDTPPPPPPDDPPPPPALPDVPLPTVMQPPSPVVNMPEPEAPPISNPAPLPVTAMPVAKPAKVRRAPVASSPQPAAVTDASPSDYLDAPPPGYPYEARASHQEGTVILLVMINDGGEPVSVSIDRSSGYPTLDRVAQHQVADHFRFKVGSSRVLRVPIDFHL